MTRSRFFFNSSVIRQNLRQHGWIGIIYTLCLMFMLPLQLFLSSYPGAEPRKVDNLFAVGGDRQLLFTAIIPVAAGLLIFRYLQAKMPSDLWHSLPLRREHLLTAHTMSGLVLLLSPVWLTAAVTALVTPLDGNMYIYQGADIWEWCLSVTVLTLFLYVFSLFVGICTGQSVLQGIIVYILLFLPMALLEFINTHFSMYLYGYPSSLGSHGNMDNWSPLVHILEISSDPFSAGELWAYLGLSILFMTLSYVLYRKRHMEKAGQALAFKYFNPLFKAGVMLCAMLLLGTYLSHKQQPLGWVLASYFVGAVLGYAVSEMILRKTWHIMNRRVPAEFAIYGVLLGLLLYIPVSEMSGYEKRVPDTSKISGVYTGSEYRLFTGERDYLVSYPSSVREDPFTEDKEYIEAVRKLHQALVTVRPETQTKTPQFYRAGYKEYTIAYKLNNGRKLVRDYQIPPSGFEPEMKAVMESEGFKRLNFNLAQLETNVESIRLSELNKVFSISDPQDIAEFTEILKREILNMSYETQVGDQKSVAYIQTLGKPDDTGYQVYGSYNWDPSFHELESWLEQKGYAAKVRITASDVISAEIIKDDYEGKLSPKEVGQPEQHVELARSENRAAAVKDPALIEHILKSQRNYMLKNGAYMVRIKYKDQTIEYAALRDEDVIPGLKVLLP